MLNSRLPIALPLLALLCIFFSSHTTALADRITLTNGRVVSCKVLAETDQTVTITEDPEASDVLTFGYPRADVTSIERDPVPAGPTYLEIPLVGTFGEEITADAVAQALNVARQRSVTYVIFLIDSPGGRVDELDKLVALMANTTDLTTIAFVKRAYSAAAIFSASCKHILMYPGGQLGAALPYKTQNGIPVEVNEKLTSAVRSIARSAATSAGRDPALFEAMVDPTIELRRPEANPATPPLKSRGRVLTLNDAEAASLRISDGTCRTLGDLRMCLKIDQWSPAGERGRRIMEKSARAAAQKRLQADYSRQSVPELTALRDRLLDRQNQIAAIQTTLREMESTHRKALLGIQRDYDTAAAEALRTLDAEHNLAKAIETRQQATDAAVKSFDEAAGKLLVKLKPLIAENEADAARAKEIISSAPPQE